MRGLRNGGEHEFIKREDRKRDIERFRDMGTGRNKCKERKGQGHRDRERQSHRKVNPCGPSQHGPSESS